MGGMRGKRQQQNILADMRGVPACAMRRTLSRSCVRPRTQDARGHSKHACLSSAPGQALTGAGTYWSNSLR